MGHERRDQEALSTEEFARWWKETGEQELRQILFWKWDPIGVWDSFPSTADEYDGYAPQVVRALRDGATEDDIARLLHGIEHEAMELGRAGLDHLEEVAQFLVQWFEDSQGWWRDDGGPRRVARG